MTERAPRGVRLHIALFGRRNVGKSQLVNALVGQDIAIVSERPGTTTDVVEKAFELKPLGPVTFLDTAGFDDDDAELGEKRVARSWAALERSDIALLVVADEFGAPEEAFAAECAKRSIPVLAVFNKADAIDVAPEVVARARTFVQDVVRVSAIKKLGLEQLGEAIVRNAPSEFLSDPGILQDLVGPGDVVVLVVPIDLSAPKGRLILPQVQVLREVLDCDARAVVVKERELADTLAMLNKKPRLVVTDSQAILKVSADVPPDVPVTGFSVLFARWKGDLETFVEGTLAINRLKAGARILIAEACSHHAIGDDIGRVKIPRWLRQYVGAELQFTHVQGHDFPNDLSKFDLVVLCGACMTNRREVLSRIMHAKQAGVPISNYGLCIAYSLGVFERMLSPFPSLAALAAKERKRV